MSERIWLASHPPGRPDDIDPDQYRSLADLFDQVVDKHAERPAFHNPGRTLSHSGVDKLARDLAAFLPGLPGMGRGERVASMLPSPLHTAPELEHPLRDSGARTIVVAENFATRCATRRRAKRR